MQKSKSSSGLSAYAFLAYMQMEPWNSIPAGDTVLLYVDHIHFMIWRISSLISSVGLPAFTALFRKFSSAVLIRRTSLGLSATTTFFSFFQNTITTYLFLLCYLRMRLEANVRLSQEVEASDLFVFRLFFKEYLQNIFH